MLRAMYLSYKSEKSDKKLSLSSRTVVLAIISFADVLLRVVVKIPFVYLITFSKEIIRSAVSKYRTIPVVNQSKVKMHSKLIITCILIWFSYKFSDLLMSQLHVLLLLALVF